MLMEIDMTIEHGNGNGHDNNARIAEPMDII
jgi:hypothetical protein